MGITKVKGGSWDSEDNGLGVNVKDYGAIGDGIVDDTAAIQSAIDAATSSGRLLMWAAGEYKIASDVSSSSDTPLSWKAEGKVTLNCYSPISISGISSSLTLASSIVQAQKVVPVVSATGVAVGDILHLSADVVVESYRAEAVKRTIGRVASIGGNNITLDEDLIFPFSTGDAGLSLTNYKPRTVRIEGINFVAKTGVSGSRAITLTGVADSVGYLNCSFTTDSDKNGGLDCEMIQVSMNVNPSHCNYSNARYGAMRLTTRNCALKYSRGSYVRHLTYPAFWAMDGEWESLVAESCTAGFDCHSSFNQSLYNSDTYNDDEISNWRSSGCVIKNVTLRLIDSLSAASENGFVISPQLWGVGYTYLNDFTSVIVKGLYIDYMSGVSPTSKTIIGVSAAKLADVEVETNLTEGFASLSQNSNNIGRAILRSDSLKPPAEQPGYVIRCPLELISPTGKVDFELDGGISKYALRSYPVGCSTEAGLRKQEVSGRLFSTTSNVSAQVIDCRLFDALDPLANSLFTAEVVIGVLDIYVYGFSASSARFDYAHYQWGWSHNMVGSTSGQFEPSLRLIAGSTSQPGDGLTMAVSAASKSGVPADTSFRLDQYIDFTLTQAWAYSGKLVIDYKLKVTQINQ